jgi:hypothetical protein
MYLTDKKNGVLRNMHEHEELEVLLEFFSKQVEEIANEAENIEVDSLAHIVLPKTLPSSTGQRSIHSGDCRTHLGL